MRFIRINSSEYLRTNSLNICIIPSIEYSHKNVRKMVLNKLGLRFDFFEFSSSMFHRLQNTCITIISMLKMTQKRTLKYSLFFLLLFFFLYMYIISILTFLIDLRVASIGRFSEDQISRLFLKLFCILS